MKLLLLTGILTICFTPIVLSLEDETELDRCRQNITSIDENSYVLKNAPLSLVHLYLCNNDLETIEKNSFQRFKKLEKLILDKNSRLKFNADGSEFLELGSLTDLQCFRCGVDKIYNRSLQGMPRLEQINLTENCIEQIEANAFLKNKNLEIIDLRANELRRIPSKMLVELARIQWINLSRNRELASEGSEPFLISKVLEKLWCDECGFVSVQETTFANLPGLKELHLRGNKISHIHELAFSQVPLATLMLERNSLKSINSRILNVATVCLDKNSDELQCFLRDLPDYRRFFCSRSSKKEITCLIPTTIQVSTISTIDITNTTDITTISMEGRMAMNTTDDSDTFAKTETPITSAPSTPSSEIVEGISDAYISGYLTLIYLAQIATFVLLLGVWLKLKKYDSDPDVDRYAENIINPNPIYKAIH